MSAIFLATTFPTREPHVGRIATCVVCGERGLADALLNIALFAPLGAALALAGWRTTRVIGAGAVVSLLIELLQLFVITGRNASVGDVVFNTLGAGLGWTVVSTASVWLAPAPSRRTVLAVAWSIISAATIAGTGVLFAPALTRLDYYGGWTPRLRHLAWYDGRVVAATLGGTALPSARIDDPVHARAALVEGDSLRVRAVAGPRGDALAPVLMVHDEGQHEMMLLGVQQDDLVFRYRTRSTALRLSQPDLRAPGLMRGVGAGDVVVLAAWRDGTGYCLQRDADRRCGIGHTVGRAWSMLMYPEGLPDWCRAWLDVAWMIGLFVPLGFWLPLSPRGLLALAPPGIALVAAPELTGLVPSRPSEILAAFTGVVAGAVIARWVAQRGGLEASHMFNPTRRSTTHSPAISLPRGEA